MAKIYAVKADYVRKRNIQAALADMDKYKKGAEERMSFYDEQPVICSQID